MAKACAFHIGDFYIIYNKLYQKKIVKKYKFNVRYYIRYQFSFDHRFLSDEFSKLYQKKIGKHSLNRSESFKKTAYSESFFDTQKKNPSLYVNKSFERTVLDSETTHVYHKRTHLCA